MKQIRNFILLSLVTCGFTFSSFAQTSNAEKLSATRPASLSSANAPSKAKMEVEKYFNVVSLDAQRSSTNDALTQWQTASRGATGVHEAYLKERELYLTELNKFVASTPKGAASDKARAEVKRISEIK